MGLFEYPAHPVARSRAGRSSTADDRFFRPIIPLRIGRPDASSNECYWLDARIDSGADLCQFSEYVAERIGVRRGSHNEEKVQRTASGGLFQVWIATVQLHLGRAGDRYEFDWSAQVGFVPVATREAFGADRSTSIIGVRGGLDRFLETTLVLNGEGIGSPQVRIYTPDQIS